MTRLPGSPDVLACIASHPVSHPHELEPENGRPWFYNTEDHAMLEFTKRGVGGLRKRLADRKYDRHGHPMPLLDGWQRKASRATYIATSHFHMQVM